MERQVVFKALVGSHNYNLNTPDSDKDYKIFLFPTFEDLYRGKEYSKNIVGTKIDVDYHDIRKLVRLFWKSNLNFIEVLYSTEIECVDLDYVKDTLEQIFEMRDEIVTMNLPYLYKACKGMYFNKIKYLEKGTSGTQDLVTKYNFDTKQGLHAYRILDFIMRFAATDFTDFKYAMTYSEDEREFILSIKDGYYSLEEYKSFIDKKYMEFEHYEDIYLNQTLKEDVKDRLDRLICELVKKHIIR